MRAASFLHHSSIEDGAAVEVEGVEIVVVELVVGVEAGGVVHKAVTSSLLRLQLLRHVAGAQGLWWEGAGDSWLSKSTFKPGFKEKRMVVCK